MNCQWVYPKWEMKSSSEKSFVGRLHGRSLVQIIFQRNWKCMEYNTNHLLQLILIEVNALYYIGLHLLLFWNFDLNEWPSVQPPNCKLFPIICALVVHHRIALREKKERHHVIVSTGKGIDSFIYQMCCMNHQIHLLNHSAWIVSEFLDIRRTISMYARLALFYSLIIHCISFVYSSLPRPLFLIMWLETVI